MEPKKTARADLSRKTGLFFNVGLAVSLVIVLMAFEYKTYDDTSIVDFSNDSEFMLDEIIPPTDIPPPPPPPRIQPPQITEVDDDEEIEIQDIDIDMDVTDQTVIEDLPPIVEVEAPKENPDQIFLVVEQGATPKGGFEAFYKYVGKRLNGNYPAQARRMGIDGKVFVGFVVNQDGSIVDVEIVKGIGAGCDDLAKKIIQESPSWTPGKQRGKPVRQKMVIHITFKLQ